MQNRYAGDVGDFIKLGLLRHLASPPTEGGAGLSIAVNWYLVPDENHNRDGRHTAYLEPRNPWHRELAACDPDLIRRLASVIGATRSVKALELSGALPAHSLSYERVLLPSEGPEGRRQWHIGALRALAGASLVFADPDNGIQGSEDTRSKAHKFAHISELADYASRGQGLVVYHHADRTRGGVRTQAQRRLTQLACAVGQEPVGAVIAHRGSCRFFLASAAKGHRERLAAALHEFAKRWAAHVDLVD